MHGIARFIDVADDMKHYQETGTYLREKIEYSFYQNQLFIFQEERLFIKKKNGVLLHEFDLPIEEQFPIVLQHNHHCKDDRYQLELCLNSSGTFSSSYLVSGPNKKYYIKTNYWR
jgi:hypothetical protein